MTLSATNFNPHFPEKTQKLPSKAEENYHLRQSSESSLIFIPEISFMSLQPFNKSLINSLTVLYSYFPH